MYLWKFPEMIEKSTYTTPPSIEIDDVTFYYATFHIYAPAQHKFLNHPRHPNDYPYAELHHVYTDPSSNYQAVVHVLLDGSRDADAAMELLIASFSQPLIGHDDIAATMPASLDLSKAVATCNEGAKGFCRM